MFSNCYRLIPSMSLFFEFSENWLKTFSSYFSNRILQDKNLEQYTYFSTAMKTLQIF